MKYLPLVWAAFRRHTAESLLTFLVLTVAFTLFSSMVALRAAYDHAIEVNRMDRLIIHARFCCTGINIARRAEIERIPGVRGAGLIQGVFGFFQEPSRKVGVWTIDAGTIAAIPELGLTLSNWKLLQDTPNGLLFTRTQAAKWNVKVGDVFPVKNNYSRRADRTDAWPFTVVGIVNDPLTQVDWMPNIYGSYDYLDASRIAPEHGLVDYVVAIDNPDDAPSICRKIDTLYANSETPTYCVPLQMDARNMVDSVITMRQMSLGIGTAGLFMILFLCASSVAESVRERVSEFAVLKTIGFGDRQVAALVFFEAALPALAGAVLGTALAGALGSFTSKLGEGSGLNLPTASISVGIAALALGIALLIGAMRRGAPASAASVDAARACTGGPVSVLRQLLAVSAIGVSTLPQRRGTSLVIVAGVACVVAVLVSMLSIAVGQTHMSLAGGGRDRAIIHPKDVSHESNSNLGRDQISLVLNAPGIARGPDGAPLADAEFQLGVMPPLGTFGDQLQIRGVGPTGIRIRDEFRLESGRMFRSGAQELIIGVGASKVLGLKIGDKVLMPGGFWPIVGTFSNGGDAAEGTFFADAETLLSITRRRGYASVIAKLAGPAAFDELHDWIAGNPTLKLDTERVPDYLLRRTGGQLAFLTRATYAIGVIMALGALFGATKIMYAAVRARTREIGTLRALGFGSAPVAGSVLLEATLLALGGAAVGTLLAWLLFDGRVVYSGGVFKLRVSASLVALGLAWGLVIAVLGGLFPAIRAAKLAAAEALRAV